MKAIAVINETEDVVRKLCRQIEKQVEVLKVYYNTNEEIIWHSLRTTSSVSLITIVNRCTLSISLGDVFKLSILIFLREKIIAMRFSKPI